MRIDCSPLVPEARRPACEAARACVDGAAGQVLAVVAVGSAVKGGFIPGWSDIDLQVYFADEAFDGDALVLPVALSIQRGLGTIDASPFLFISCSPILASNPRDAPPLVSGAYAVLCGEVARPEATRDELRAQGREALALLGTVPPYLSIGLLEHGGGRLELLVRRLCGEVWRTLYHLLAVTNNDPIASWVLSKPEALEIVPTQTPVGSAIRSFYAAVIAYMPSNQNSVEHALRVIDKGLVVLQTIDSEWRGKGQST